MAICRINVRTVLFFTLLNIWLLYTPTDGKCRGKWLIHACGGGNGKRSDVLLAHAPPDRKLGIFLGWREPDARSEQTTEEDRGGSSIQTEGWKEEDLVGGEGLNLGLGPRRDPSAGLLDDDDVVLRSTDLKRSSERSKDLTGDVDQSVEDQAEDREEDVEDQGESRKDRILRGFWQRFFSKSRPKQRRLDGRRFLNGDQPSNVAEDF